MMRYRIPTRLVFVATGTIFGFAQEQARAITFTWTGNASNTFNNANNWTPGGGPPGAGDTGTIEMPDNITLSATTEAINTLNIRSGASVNTTPTATLDVTGGANGFTEVVDDSTLHVTTGGFGRFVTDTLSLRLGGELKMDNGGAGVNLIARVSLTGVISGRGTVFLTAGSGIGLDLAGFIRPDGGGTLGFASGGATFDLDGNTGGNDFNSTIDVIADTDLAFGGAGLTDPFSGRMDIGNNRRVEFTTDPFTMDDGELNITSGTTSRLVAPSITFMSGADITVQGADGQFEGTTTFNAGSTVFLLNAADDLRLMGNTTIQSGVAFSGSGALNIAAGKSLKLLNNANVNVKVVHTGNSELTIGTSPGKATVGAYLPSALSTLKIELGGVTPATQFDQLAVTGSATLAGTLAISLINAFTPAAGNSFQILTFGSRTGDFNDITGDYFGQGLFLKPIYSATDLTLVTTQAGPGDTDLDGDVDLNDLGNLATSFGKSNASIDWINGDFDNDNDVDLNDLGTLATNFEAGRAAALAQFDRPVPEPIGGAGLLILSHLLSGRRRSRK
jgi:hypothetical protein